MRTLTATPFGSVLEAEGEPGTGPADRLRGLLASALRTVTGGAAVTTAVLAGERDENRLSNIIFHSRHPERHGRSIARGETAASREWLDIRTRIVRPMLRALAAAPAAGGASPAPAAASGACADVPPGPYARLVVTRPGIAFDYRITPDDVLWTARMIEGEAGGRPDADNYAVVWAMLNRFALLTNRKRLKNGYDTFAAFIRRYSTPLQPVLSYGSAKHHYRKPDFVKVGGSYEEDPAVPRGQLRKHVELQRKCWGQLRTGARQAARLVMSGGAPNPIGLATEFANTATYYYRKHGTRPNRQQWLDYTAAFGRSKRSSRGKATLDKGGWVWIGDRANLHQMSHNTFFLRSRPVSGDSTKTPIAELPEGTVQLRRP